MLHKAFFAFLMLFSGSCGAAALISSIKEHQDISGAITGAAVVLMLMFILFAVKIWFHPEPAQLKPDAE